MNKEQKKIIKEVQEMIIKIIDKYMIVDYTVSEDIANEIILWLIAERFINGL